MRSAFECVPCFFKQALEAARISNASKHRRKKLINHVSEVVEKYALKDIPPKTGRRVYRTVEKVTRKKDIFAEIKKASNRKARKTYPGLKKKADASGDSLLGAIKLAIAGNVIDYGAAHKFDVKYELNNFLNVKFAIFDYKNFKRSLKKASWILYLADNAGEIVFDRALIEKLKRPVIVAVRDKPIINDATIRDAKSSGLDKIAKVISSGSDAPGTVLELCSKKFLKFFNKAPMIISKGQGNYEALEGCGKNIFYLFKVKCDVVASHLGCKPGSVIFKAERNS